MKPEIGESLHIYAFRLLKPAKENISFKLAFRGINIFAIVIVLLLSIEKLFIQH